MADSASEQRISTLIGDRLCARCGYNLMGQPVLREPHYQMLIVRCPECASVASVQEYPLLGRWANRWAALLAAVWLFVLIGMWIGTAALIFGFSIGTAEVASERYADFMRKRYEAWATINSAAGAGGIWALNDYDLWINAEDQEQMFQDAGGWAQAVHWRAFSLWIPYGVLALVFGSAWAVTLLGRRWAVKLLVLALIMAVACFFSMFPMIEWLEAPRSWWNLGRQKIAPLVMVMSLAYGCLMLGTGLWIGRSLVRRLLTVLLPPRLCHSLAILWTSDGLVPPRPQAR